MDNELIKITTKDGKQLVSARELHEFLGIGVHFSTWMKRMCEYGFEENIDFSILKSGNPNGGIAKIDDYAITIDMAKEISMIQRSDKGKQARLYFIECEKKLKEVDIKGQLLLAIYNGGQEGVVASRQLVELETKPLLDKIEEQTPKVEYFDKVLDPKDEENGFTKLITTTDIAKDLGMSARKLNKLLNDKGIIYKQGNSWKVYTKYEFLIKEKYCDYKMNEFGQILKWTEKGRKFIIETISNN